MEKLKAWIKKNRKKVIYHTISICFVFLIVITSIFIFEDLGNNFVNSISFLIESFKFYVLRLAGSDINIPLIPYGMYYGSNYNLLLFNINTFVMLMFNSDNLLFAITKVELLWLIISIFIIFLPLVLIILFGMHNSLFTRKSDKTLEKIKPTSKPLLLLQKLQIRFRDPFKKITDALKDYYKFFKKNYVHLFVLSVLFASGLLSLMIVIFGLIIIIVPGQFAPQILMSFPLVIIDYIIPVLINVPFILLLLGFYAVMSYMRHKNAIKMQKKRYKSNMELTEDFPALTLILGPPGAGKDLIGTTLTKNAECLLRDKLKNKLLKYYNYFPDFPFEKVEQLITTARKDNIIHNHVQARYFMSDKIGEMLDKSNNLYIFTYNMKTNATNRWMGTYDIALKETILNYSEVYYQYSIIKPLIVAPIGIRTDYKVTSHKNCFPTFEYDLFTDDYKDNYYKSQYSTILDWDSHREGKKMNTKDDSYYHFLDGQIEYFPEIDKERLNQKTAAGESAKSEFCNTANDKTNESFKMWRHNGGTIDNLSIKKGFSNTQRRSSLNVDLRATHEDEARILKRTDLIWDLNPFTIEDRLLKLIINLCDKFYIKFRSVRFDNTLLKYLIGHLGGFVSRYYTRLENLYAYQEMYLRRESNGSEDEVGEKSIEIFYILPRQSFSKSYRTDSWAKFYEQNYLAAKKGFIDRNTFTSIDTSKEEFMMENSHHINKLLNANKLNKGEKNEDVSKKKT